jgi:hypothetical protein
MFTTPCFIRKNTPELRKKLEELGYNRYPLWMADWSDDDSRYVYLVTDVLYYTYPQKPTNPKNGEYIDCGTNEDLFLAIAALRDDSDKNQWFVNDYGYFEMCFNDKVENYLSGEGIRKYRQIDETYHKATVEELIEHFK